MKKIRVLHIIAALNGGAGTILLDYSSHMRDLCHFDYAVNYQADFEWNNEVDQKYNEKIFVFPRYYQNLLKYTIGIYRIIKKGKYDVVISHVGYASFIPLFIAKLLGVNCRIAHSHTSNRPEGELKKYIRHFRGFLTKLVSTDICACGINSAKWTWGNKDYKNGRIKIIRNAIDTHKFVFISEKREAYRSLLGMNNTTIACVCVARLSAEKNQQFLIKVWKDLIKHDNRFKLFLIGNGDDEKKLRKMIEDYKLEESVVLLGARQDVSGLLNAFDIFLLPSLFEGVPLTLIEAQANGLPIIASDNVPSEVNITGLVSFNSLNEDIWCNNILLKSLVNTNDRLTYNYVVKEKHFDINTEANRIKNIAKRRFKK